MKFISRQSIKEFLVYITYRVMSATMIQRYIQSDLVELLQSNPAVALLGARQVGKTTLSLKVTANLTRPTLYLDL
jgi:predicted AAA+ superfamily ATPase